MAADVGEKTIGDLFTLQRGTTYKGALLGQPGPVLLGLASIQRNGGFRNDSLRTYGGDSPAKLLVHPGELYVSLKDVTQSADLLGAVARVPQSQGPGRLTQDTVKLEPRSADVPLDYIYWLLRTPRYREFCRAHATGTTNLGLPRDDFLSFRIPPLTPLRAHLTRLLCSLDDKIELNRRLNETLEGMARALFKSWFVDFDPVRAKAEGRDPGLPKHLADLFPDRLVDSELGEIPEGWRAEPLERQLDVLETGGRPKGGVSMYETGVPSIGAESIVGLGVHDFSKTKYVPREFFEKMKRGHLADRDVLLYKDGGRPGLFEPHVTMVGDGFPFEECAINEHVYRIRADPALGQNFLFFWLSSEATMDEMRVKGTGVAIPGLNSTQVKSLTTLVPASAVVRAFDDLVVPAIGRILAGGKGVVALSEIRDTLLGELFRL